MPDRRAEDGCSRSLRAFAVRSRISVASSAEKAASSVSISASVAFMRSSRSFSERLKLAVSPVCPSLMASSASRTACGSASSRIRRPMYCICLRRPSCELRRCHSRTASRMLGVSGILASTDEPRVVSSSPIRWSAVLSRFFCERLGRSSSNSESFVSHW